MFRKFADRLNALWEPQQDGVTALQSMGFDASQAQGALEATNGDVQRAAELLLAAGGGGGNSSLSHTTVATPPSSQHDASNDNDLQRAMQESMQIEEDRQLRVAAEASAMLANTATTSGALQKPRTAAMNKAAQAAEQRAIDAMNKYKPSAKGKATSSKPTPVQKPSAAYLPQPPPPKVNVALIHHPNVKVPAKLQDKSKEEQILRCGDRIKSYPAAVDTLYRALTAIQKDPANDKFRKIDKTTAGYQRSLEGVPGAEALLLAMNFCPRGPNTLVLERVLVDPALLFLGISALEQAKSTAEYQDAKRKIQFAKDVKDIQFSGDSSAAEAIRRAEFMSKCPSEPSEGRGALVQVVMADETIRRRFDGDDVLRDVLHWLGGHGSVIPDKILTREWCLVDVNRYPLAPIDCEHFLDKTLQYIGCWPSGRLEILPSSEEWRLNGSASNLKPGSSRGLGSAPRDC